MNPGTRADVSPGAGWSGLVRPYAPCPIPADPVRGRSESGGIGGDDGDGELPGHTTAGQRGAGGRGLLLTPPDHPARALPRVLGRANAGPPDLIALDSPDARYHFHVIGRTGVGKSTWLANYVLGEARAGRGVALIDCQGDLSRKVLDRLPAECGDRLVILDPAEQAAPPAYNPLAPDCDDPTGQAGEWAAEHLVGTFRALYAASWGARMEDFLRGACLTLVRRPDSTLADILALLTDAPFRRDVLDQYGTPEGLGTLWADFEALTPSARSNLCAPLVTRLRGVLSRRFARELLTPAESTLNLGQVLDGGVLVARLPKGEIGAETSRLISGLLISGLWGHTARRSSLDEDQRPDASILLDEAQNALSLPVDVDLALAESRGYRVSWVLAHQHGDQIPPKVAAAIAANARNKVIFSVEPDDARKLVRHVRPWLTEHDLSARPAWEICARTVAGGHDQQPYTLDALPLPAPIAGRADYLRARARARTGLPRRRRRAGQRPAGARSTEAAAASSTPPDTRRRRSRLATEPPAHDANPAQRA
ncbi:hypothetical protein GCM10023321_72580 [Pseudonocardia eucalypti]|uniref:Type IV secretion system coupling TraD/TrwB family protein n=1 Tax=Pseudonocardia eucalypti TaxID=648755 RepID=A0ABP9R7Q5_9PSEU|nr:hypothetical protein [Pseudonocardia eucalypti]